MSKPIGEVVAAYAQVRDARSELTKDYNAKYKVLGEAMDKLNMIMVEYLKEQKLDGSKAAGLTFYKQLDTQPSAEDWDDVYNWIRQGNGNERFEILQKRLGQGFVVAFMAAHTDAETGAVELPPGVKVRQDWKVTVRKTGDK